MPGHTEVLAALLDLLPPVPGEVTGVLHVVAFVGAVYVLGLGGLRFSTSGVELFGRRMASREVLLGLAVGAVLVATAQWWAPLVFFLSGWQALGLVCLEAGWLIQSTANGVDVAAVAMAVAGLVLLVLPWAV
jgi:hypothetical protein